MVLREAGEIRMLFEEVANEHILPLRESITETADDWLLEKQESFYGDEYIEQLEEGTVLLVESLSGILQTISRFLYQGSPWVRDPMEFRAFTAAIRRYYGNIHMKEYLEFIREGDSGQHDDIDPLLVEIKNEYHIQPITAGVNFLKFDTLRKIRKAGDFPRYIDELEFDCKYYQAALFNSEIYLGIFFQIPGLAGSAHNIPLETVLNTVEERIRIRTSLILDLIRIQLPSEWLESQSEE